MVVSLPIALCSLLLASVAVFRFRRRMGVPSALLAVVGLWAVLFVVATVLAQVGAATLDTALLHPASVLIGLMLAALVLLSLRRWLVVRLVTAFAVLGISLVVDPTLDQAERDASLAIVGSASSGFEVVEGAADPAAKRESSPTLPKPALLTVALDHILHGEVGPDGSYSGGHWLGSHSISTWALDGPDAHGVRWGCVSDRSRRAAGKFSSFYPIDFSEGDVLDAVHEAWSASGCPNKRSSDGHRCTCEGPTLTGFRLRLHYNTASNRIESAYPIAERPGSSRGTSCTLPEAESDDE